MKWKDRIIMILGLSILGQTIWIGDMSFTEFRTGPEALHEILVALFGVVIGIWLARERCKT